MAHISSCVLVILYLLAFVSATTYNWSRQSGDWATSLNWEPRGVPGVNDTANIGNGKAVSIVLRTVLVGSINLATESRLIIDQATLSTLSLQNNGTVVLSNATLIPGMLILSNRSTIVVNNLQCGAVRANSTLEAAVTLPSGSIVVMESGTQLKLSKLVIQRNVTLRVLQRLFVASGLISPVIITTDQISGSFFPVKLYSTTSNCSQSNAADVNKLPTCAVQSGSSISVLLGPESSKCPESFGTVCAAQWTGPDCTIPLCPGADQNCSNHGTCSNLLNTPSCVCDEGWASTACDVGICPGTPVACGGNQRGYCNSTVPSGAQPYCVCTTAQWGGVDCSMPIRNQGDNSSITPDTTTPITQTGMVPIATPPLTSLMPCGGCLNNGTCNTITNTCTCDSINWSGAHCEQATCLGDTTVLCSANGHCETTAIPHVCVCDPHWTGVKCEIPDCAGGCSGRGTCSAQTTPPKCICFAGWDGANCNISLDGSTSAPASPSLSTGTNLLPIATFLVIATVIVVAIVVIAAFCIGPYRVRSFFAAKPSTDNTEYFLAPNEETL